jgi:hypothetical protein
MKSVILAIYWAFLDHFNAETEEQQILIVTAEIKTTSFQQYRPQRLNFCICNREVYSIQHYVIMFASLLRQVGDILWIYNYLCNQCLSTLTLRVRTPFMVRWTRYNNIINLAMSGIRYHNVSYDCIGGYKSKYHTIASTTAPRYALCWWLVM